MNRRKFIEIGLIGGGLSLMAVGGKFYLDDSKMKIPRKEGYWTVDLHNHIDKPETDKELKKLLERIVDVGVVGSGLCMPLPSDNVIYSYDKKRVSFDYLANLNLKPKIGKIHEIDKRRSLEIELWDGRTGYFFNVQEIGPNVNMLHRPYYRPHLLVVGCPEKLPSNGVHIAPVLADINKSGSYVQVNHPGTVSMENGFPPYRLINKDEIEKLKGILNYVHEVEIFNAQQINLALGIDLPFFEKLNMKKANRWAKRFVEENKIPHIKGVKGSDAHELVEQVGTTGIFIPKDGPVCFEWLKSHLIDKKDFVQAPDQYVSRWSFIQGMAHSLFK